MTARPQDVALLPCPFCGGPGKLYDSEAGRDGLPRTYRDAGCTQCFLRFGYAPAHEAAAMWNRRSDAALASAQAREDELRAEVRGLRRQQSSWGRHVAAAGCEYVRDEEGDTLVNRRAERLEEALRYALNQNEHDMVLTGDEIRAARAALSTNAATQTGETNEAAE